MSFVALLGIQCEGLDWEKFAAINQHYVQKVYLYIKLPQEKNVGIWPMDSQVWQG